jgi:hypothetical protein
MRVNVRPSVETIVSAIERGANRPGMRRLPISPKNGGGGALASLLPPRRVARDRVDAAREVR